MVENQAIAMGGVYRPQERNEVKEMIEEINADSPEDDGFSKIDMRARLAPSEISAILGLDIAVSMGALPFQCSKLTRAKKRLSVSIRGQGRKEMVEIAGADKVKKSEMNSMIDRMQGK